MKGGNSEDDHNGFNREETRATRLKADTEQAFIEYRDERGLTDAEALRRLVRAGIKKKTENEYSLRDQASTALAVAFITGWPTYATAAGNTNAAIAYVIGLSLIAFLEPQITATLGRAKAKLP
jgi:hypothetical protein